ncbi:MAG: HAMP domain-containing sensor histidine kinase [Clostridiaceae bacterium]|nr:HAMP domain-containing sensor histidine kinase [Clostridiaceae bacterium]
MSRKLAERSPGMPLYPKLRRRFQSVIFSFMLFSMLFGGVLLVLANRFGVFRPLLRANPLIAVLVMYGASLGLASLLAYYVGRQLVEPIERLSRASSRIARGDFSVRLEPDTRIDELDTTFRSFNAMARELSSVETLREDFVASVSHEFKTPLSAIEGYATLLQDKSLTESEREDCVRKILASVDRLSTLSGNILLLSKLENGSYQPEKKEYRLDEQLREAVLMHEQGWSKKGQELDIDLPELRYYGCESLLLQLWSNLIGNAVKYTPENGHIAVRMTADDATVTVEVADDGIGMDEETQRHIFEKFYQGDPSRRSEGNGLGLALCRTIAERCGGSIAVRSRPREGSCFTVRLPR